MNWCMFAMVHAVWCDILVGGLPLLCAHGVRTLYVQGPRDREQTGGCACRQAKWCKSVCLFVHLTVCLICVCLCVCVCVHVCGVNACVCLISLETELFIIMCCFIPSFWFCVKRIVKRYLGKCYICVWVSTPSPSPNPLFILLITGYMIL